VTHHVTFPMLSIVYIPAGLGFCSLSFSPISCSDFNTPVPSDSWFYAVQKAQSSHQTLQFPLALFYCLHLCFLSPLLISHSGSLNLSIYVSCICSTSSELRLLAPICLSSSSHLPPLSHTCLRNFQNSGNMESRISTLPHTQKSRILEGFHREQGNTLSPPR